MMGRLCGKCLVAIKAAFAACSHLQNRDLLSTPLCLQVGESGAHAHVCGLHSHYEVSSSTQ